MRFLPKGMLPWLSGVHGFRLDAESGRLVPKEEHYPLSLNAPFLPIPGGPAVPLRQILRHTLTSGTTGAGKTSGPGAFYLHNFLVYGFGGIYFCIKSDDADRIIELAHLAGRQDSLIVVSPDNPQWTCNVIEAVLALPPEEGGGDVDEAAEMLMEIFENNSDDGQRHSSDPIWTNGTRRFIKHGMLIHYIARMPITMDNLLAVANSLPTLHPMSGQLVWPEDSHLHRCFEQAEALGADPDALKECRAYFCIEMLRPGSARFIASILGSFTNMADKFMSKKIKKLFFGNTTYTPAFSRKGAIIVLDLGRYGSIGRIGMLLFKNIWCRELLRRQGLPPGERPCFLYCDEYQTLTTPIDGRLFEKGRSSWVSACCLVQNYPSLYKAFEAGRAHDQVDNMLGNFANLIFTQQHCRITNHIAAEILAKSKVLRHSGGTTVSESEQRGWNAGSSGNSSSGSGGSSAGGGWSSGSSGGSSTSQGINEAWREEYDYLVHEEVFSRLRVGPPKNTVESILFSSGMQFTSTGRPWVPLSWPQR